MAVPPKKAATSETETQLVRKLQLDVAERERLVEAQRGVIKDKKQQLDSLMHQRVAVQDHKRSSGKAGLSDRAVVEDKRANNHIEVTKKRASGIMRSRREHNRSSRESSTEETSDSAEPLLTDTKMPVYLSDTEEDMPSQIPAVPEHSYHRSDDTIKEDNSIEPNIAKLISSGPKNGPQLDAKATSTPATEKPAVKGQSQDEDGQRRRTISQLSRNSTLMQQGRKVGQSSLTPLGSNKILFLIYELQSEIMKKYYDRGTTATGRKRANPWEAVGEAIKSEVKLWSTLLELRRFGRLYGEMWEWFEHNKK